MSCLFSVLYVLHVLLCPILSPSSLSSMFSLSSVLSMSSMSCRQDEITLTQMSDLMDNRRKRGAGDNGEQSLIGPPSGQPVSGPGGDILDQDASTPCLYVLAFFSALGGFLFGYDTGVVSGAMLLLKKEMNLSNLWQELLVSSTVGAAALAALAGGSLNGWLGRRICILLASFIFSVGGIILTVAPGKLVLLVGRIVVGLGIGEWELCPTKSRHKI